MQEKTQRPPVAQAPVSVILLATGTTSDAAERVDNWRTFLATLDRPFEIFVLGLSDPADGNPAFASARLIECDLAIGHGRGLQGAIRAAQYPLVMLSTTDRQFQPVELQRLLGVIDHVDLAVGCRSVADWPWWARLVGRLFTLAGKVVLGLPSDPGECRAGATPWDRRWIARWLLGVRLRDPESPLRLMRREAVNRIVLQSEGPFTLVEQLAKANHLELIMTEEPVSWTPPPEPVSYVSEAWELFRRPDFGPVELHVPPPQPAMAPLEQAIENPEPAPTKPDSLSSEREDLTP